MSAVTAFDDEQNDDRRRWVTSALTVAVLHVSLFAIWDNWPDDPPPAGTAIPPIVIDMSPMPTSPSDTQLDLAPDPPMQQAEAASAPPENPAYQPEQTPIEPIPLQSEAEVVLQARKEQQPHPSESEAVQQKEFSKPKEKSQKVDNKKKQHEERKPVPRTSASPRTEHRALAMASAQSGLEAASVLPSYRDRLAAHLQRYKQYPAAERAAGIQGTPVVSFTISRTGQVLSSRLARSSGNAALDSETMSMIRRAQPMPSFPSEITVGSMSFTVPIRFSVR